MTKEELEKEAEEWVISNTEIYDDKFGIEGETEPRAKEAYLAGAEPRAKRIAELEAQIEKMKSDVELARDNANKTEDWETFSVLNSILDD